MPAYDYTALDGTGKTTRGLTEAESERDARRLLRERGLIPITIDQSQRAQAAQKLPLGSSRRMSPEGLALFTQTLATLLQAGLPVDDAMSAIVNQTDDQKTKSTLVDVRAKVVEGRSLEAALADFPDTFSDVYRATVGAGEQTRHLPLVLMRLGDYVQKAAQVRQQIRMAMVYPAVLSAVSILVVTGLLVYVVPDVVSVFAQTDAGLPAITRFLIGLSEFVADHGLSVVVLLLVGAWGAQRSLRRPAVYRRVHAYALKLPLIADFIIKSEYNRFSQTLGVLLGNGVEMLDALTIASKSFANSILKDELDETTRRVREGESLNAALAKCDHAPRLVCHLVASGEASGELPQLLEAAANALERDTSARLNVMLNLLEPALILTMGAVVLFIVLAILLPIFEMNTLL